MSAALTLCRGRSHDDYYFERPELITAEPPPRPYVDVTRPEISQRVINKEILRDAFSTLDIGYLQPYLPAADVLRPIETLLGIALTGLLGFVLGNKLRYS